MQPFLKQHHVFATESYRSKSPPGRRQETRQKWLESDDGKLPKKLVSTELSRLSLEAK